MRRFVSEWLSPFGQPHFRKPSQWADNLRPPGDGASIDDVRGSVPTPPMMKDALPPYRQAHVEANGRALAIGFEALPRAQAPAWEAAA